MQLFGIVVHFSDTASVFVDVSEQSTVRTLRDQLLGKLSVRQPPSDLPLYLYRGKHRAIELHDEQTLAEVGGTDPAAVFSTLPDWVEPLASSSIDGDSDDLSMECAPVSGTGRGRSLFGGS